MEGLRVPGSLFPAGEVKYKRAFAAEEGPLLIVMDRTATPDDVLPALRRAVATSAITCSRAGSNPPTRAELD